MKRLALMSALLLSAPVAAAPPANLTVRLDAEGPYLILSSAAAGREYEEALSVVRALHPGAAEAVVDLASPEALREALRSAKPRYVLVLALPGEIDVNLAWRFLLAAAAVDDDPLVDVRPGFLTGATPADALAFARRIAAAASGDLAVPRKAADVLGPIEMAPEEAFFALPKAFMMPWLPADLPAVGISHGKSGFTEARLTALAGAGLVHFGGHGYPDRIVDGVTAAQAGRLDLSPCVAWNGACYTGVTDRWFEEWTSEGKIAERRVAAADSFCLNLLRHHVIGYLAALHPDHGIPVYQEMEHLAQTGASLGEVIRQTMNTVLLAGNGAPPDLSPLTAGEPSKQRTPAEIMLRGTAARVLFGDPSLVVGEVLASSALVLTLSDADGAAVATAEVANPSLIATLTDTFRSDLSAQEGMFNDRALFQVPLSKGFSPKSVAVFAVDVGATPQRHALVAHVEEEFFGVRTMWVQVDLEAAGFMQGPWRTKGASVSVRLTR